MHRAARFESARGGFDAQRTNPLLAVLSAVAAGFA